MDDRLQEANVALLDLDKGLRAQRCGDQCEAIMKFQSTFSKYHYPTFINAAFLKLADAFRNGNNTMRLCILRVAQQSKIHLDKITSFDEFTKRIFSVTHSNDPYARAITLRMLGTISCIISEKKNVHHCICKGLDSHDRVEQEAAIFATIQFASDSHDFAASICNKIATLLKGLSTQLEIKLKLIPVLQHMRSNVQISSKARNILEDLLPSYPAQEFVLTTLKTLTMLSCYTLIDIPAQVKLLLSYVRCDPRKSVCSSALDNLNLLARKTSHLWSVQDIEESCKTLNQSSISDLLKRKLLRVLCTLFSNTSVVKVDLSEDSQILYICSLYMLNMDVMQAALAIKLQTSLLPHALKYSKYRYESLRNGTIDAVDGILLILVPSATEASIEVKALKIILSVLRNLLDESGTSESRLYEIIFTLFETDERLLEECDEAGVVLLETLAILATNSDFPNLLSPYKSNIHSMLLKIPVMEQKPNREKISIFIFVLMSVCALGSEESILSNKIIHEIKNSSLDHWTLYRIARQAFRLSQFNVASKLLQEISDSVATEQHHFWITGLKEIALAEYQISKCFQSNQSNPTCLEIDRTITEAVNHYHTAISIFMAAVEPNRNLNFQCEYARLRCETLRLHLRFISACQVIQNNPPPAISKDSFDFSCDEKTTENSRYYLVDKRLKQCAEQFQLIEQAYNELRMISFDCDPSTLANITACQRICSIMSFAIESLIFSRSDKNFYTNAKASQSIPSDKERSDIFSKAIRNAYTKISKLIDVTLSKEPNNLSQLLTKCLKQCSFIVLSVPQSFPRFFFQSLQTTRIKLTTTPGNRSSNDPFRIEAEKRLALKIEGVIQRSDSYSSNGSFTSLNSSQDLKSRRFREIKQIKLQLSVIWLHPIEGTHNRNNKPKVGF